MFSPVNTISDLNQLSDGFELSGMLSLLFPFSFPIVALLDGAGAAYVGLSAIAVFLSAFVAVAMAHICMALSYVCDAGARYVARMEREQLETTRALHAYLSNGGRA